MISRRRLLGATAALAGAATVVAGGRWVNLARIISDEDYICAVLRRYLRGFTFNNSDLRTFAREYKGEIHVRRVQRLAGVSGSLYFSDPLRERLAPAQFARIEREERRVFTAFLLSTDFFEPGRAPAAPLTYRGYGPLVCSPFARFRDS